MISHEESLEMENPWAMEFDEASTLESIKKDCVDELGSFIFRIPHDSCSFNVLPELGMLCAPTTHEDFNHLIILYCKTFRRLVVDAYVYHKHCKFCECSVALTLRLKLHYTSIIDDERGTHHQQ